MAIKNPLKTARETIKNQFEAGLEPLHVAESIKKSVTDEWSQDWKLAVSQMLDIKQPQERQGGQSHNRFAGDLQEGQEISLSKKTERDAHIAHNDNYFSEILHSSEAHAQKENAEIRQGIQEIRAEISKLAAASQELKQNFKDVTSDTMHVSVNAGKYQLNFFEWVLSNLRDARVRIESSSNWLNAVASKANKKGFWNSVKQHGTSFMLSGERVVAQQVG